MRRRILPGTTTAVGWGADSQKVCATRAAVAGNVVPAIEEDPEAAHGAEVAHPSGGLGKPQHIGRLGGGEVLEVAEEDNPPITLVELFHGGGEAALELVPGGRGGRGQLAVGQAGDPVGGGVVVVRGAGE